MPDIAFAKPALPRSGTLVLPLHEADTPPAAASGAWTGLAAEADAAAGGPSGHGQVMQVKAIGIAVGAELPVQRRHFTQSRVVGEQIGAHPLVILGHPRQLRKCRQT